MQSQMLASETYEPPRLKSTIPGSPSTRAFNASTTNHQSLALKPLPFFISPHTADSVGNPSDVAATLSHHTKFKNVNHLIVLPPCLPPRAQQSASPEPLSVHSAQVAER
jgi:hypothetical protein